VKLIIILMYFKLQSPHEHNTSSRLFLNKDYISRLSFELNRQHLRYDRENEISFFGNRYIYVYKVSRGDLTNAITIILFIYTLFFSFDDY